MAWHSAGTYRIADGRGGAGAGQQRFAPLNSWPDNANLDKARRLLWPIKQKYGRKISWADLMVLAGNVALEFDGLQDLRLRRRPRRHVGAGGSFTGARKAPGSATSAIAASASLQNPLAAVQMGLIYVNPEGPNGKPDPVAAAQRHPRNLCAHGDERRGDRGADRRRPHLRQDPWRRRSVAASAPEPEGGGDRGSGARLAQQHGTGVGADAITGGPEVTWTQTPTQWSNHFFDNLFNYRMGADQEPGGRQAVAGQERPRRRARRA